MSQQKANASYALPALKKSPLTDNLQQLHHHNLHVTDVCHKNAAAVVQQYNLSKQKFMKETQPKFQHKIQAAILLQKKVNNILKEKHHQAKKKNLQNLTKLQNYLAKQRKVVIQKQKRMMDQSLNRRQEYLKIFSATFHHSVDRRSHIKERQQKDMEKSLLLQTDYKNKIAEANSRKQNLLNQTRLCLQQKNRNILQVQAKSKSKQSLKQSLSTKKLVQKYQASVINQSVLAVEAKKRIQNKKKQDQKKMYKQSQRRSALIAKRQKSQAQDFKRDETKIAKANIQREKYINNICVNIDSKRKQRQRNVKLRTVYIQKEQEKKAQQIIEKHHISQITLKNSKQQKEKIRRQHLYDFMSNSLKQ